MRGVSSSSDLICFCGQDWWYHNRAHSDFQLMTRAAGHRKVLLVNSIGMRMPLPGKSPMPWRRVWRKFKSMLRHVRRPLVEQQDFVVMTPILWPFYGSPRGRSLNASLVRWQVQRVAKKMGLQNPDIVVTVPTAWDVASQMSRRSLIYNRSDKHSAFSEVNGQVIQGLETSLLKNSDLVLYSSRSLRESERGLTEGRAHFLDHGVDLEHFRRRPPTGLLRKRGIKGPIIGFFGGLDDYVIDFDLLERIAIERPNYQLVLIGDATLPMDRLTRYDNVHFLGFRDYREIPDLAADFDVGIMPWLDNDWITHCNPIKLKEYLALGLEIVTTWFPEIDHYRPYAHVAHGGGEFLAQIDAVVDGARSPGDRQSLLAASSWDDRTRELLELLDNSGNQPAMEAACAAS